MNNEVIIISDSDSDNSIYQETKYCISIDIGPRNGAVAVFDKDIGKLVIWEKWSIGDGLAVAQLHPNIIAEGVNTYILGLMLRIPDYNPAGSNVFVEKQLLYGCNRTASAVNCMIEATIHSCFLAGFGISCESINPIAIQSRLGFPRNRIEKKAEAMETTNLLIELNEELIQFHHFYRNSLKRDDLADAYLQGLFCMGML